MEGPLRSVSASNITEVKGPESSSSQSSGICLSDVDVKNSFSTTSFAQLSKLREASSSINVVYVPNERDLQERNTSVKRVEGEKKTTFAALPNTTTWQQQHAVSSNFPQTDSGHETPTEQTDNLLNAQLCNIRMKLEDKKRKIELKKKRMEMLWKRQRQKLGKAAFLQAVSKSPGTPDSGNGRENDFASKDVPAAPNPVASPSMVKRMSMHEIAADLDSVQKKWLHQNDPFEHQDTSIEPSPDVDQEALNIDLQTSIEHLNTSLTDLQMDISRISLQQEQVESLMKDSIDDGSHFFLHSPSIDESIQSLQSMAPSHWQFNESQSRQSVYIPSDDHVLSKKGISELSSAPKFSESQSRQGKYFPSDDHLLRKAYPEFSSAPPKPPAEDLYSKVVKSEKRQTVRSPTRSQAPEAAKRLQKPKQTEIHVVLPQVPDSDLGSRKQAEFYDVSTRKQNDDKVASKKQFDDKQGFYIPIEKKVRPRPQKRMGVVGGEVPNSVPAKSVPTNLTEESNSLGFVIGADLVHPDPVSFFCKIFS